MTHLPGIAAQNHRSGRRNGISQPGVLGLLLIGALAAPTPGACVETPEAAKSAVVVIEELHEKLLDVMRRADELGYQGRYRELAPVLKAGYDTPLICKVILGDGWKPLSAAQRADFIALFTRLSIATYASRFNAYHGESFVSGEIKTLGKGRKLVKSRLLKSGGGEPVSLDYLLNPTPQGWRIISVIAQGVNDLSLKRAEYGKVLREQGFPQLLELLNGKLQELEH